MPHQVFFYIYGAPRTWLPAHLPFERRIFEARYLDLMSRCMREQRPFGVIG
jgi:hypothetical protein